MLPFFLRSLLDCFQPPHSSILFPEGYIQHIYSISCPSFLSWLLAVGVSQDTKLNLEGKLNCPTTSLLSSNFRNATFSPFPLLSTKPLCFWAQLWFAADTYANNCYQLQFHHLVIVFAHCSFLILKDFCSMPFLICCWSCALKCWSTTTYTLLSVFLSFSSIIASCL